jgi:DNA end-binding protein Ku
LSGSASWKGSIKFGPVLTFPVIAKSAVREERIGFNQHHDECGGKLAQGAMVCTGCGEQVAKESIIKGFNGAVGEPVDGRYPGVDTAYLEALEASKTGVMELDGLVPASEIDPRYFQKSYDVLADKGGAKPYVLFLRLLERTGKVAVGKVVMAGKEYIVTLRPRDGVLAMELMYWPAEIEAAATRKAAELSIAGTEVSEAELAMGLLLVEHMATTFDPSRYTNAYIEQVNEYLAGFVAGTAPAAIAKPTPASPVDDLTAALMASLAAVGANVDAKVAAAKAPTKRKAAAA